MSVMEKKKKTVAFDYKTYTFMLIFKYFFFGTFKLESAFYFNILLLNKTSSSPFALKRVMVVLGCDYVP